MNMNNNPVELPEELLQFAIPGTPDSEKPAAQVEATPAAPVCSQNVPATPAEPATVPLQDIPPLFVRATVPVAPTPAAPAPEVTAIPAIVPNGQAPAPVPAVTPAQPTAASQAPADVPPLFGNALTPAPATELAAGPTAAKAVHSVPATPLPGFFKRVLLAASQQDIPAVIAGEHATDIWGRFYAAEEPGIREFLPPTEKCLTILGDRSVLAALAHAVQAPFSKVQGGAQHKVVGVITHGKARDSYRVEVVERLRRVPAKELKRHLVELKSASLGITLQLPSPLLCLKLQAQEAITYSEPRKEDFQHLQTLLLCNRAWLREAVKGVENETISERKAIWAFEAVLQFTQSRTAVQVAKLHELDWLQIFPVMELLKTSRVRLQKFLRTCLPGLPACHSQDAPEAQAA